MFKYFSLILSVIVSMQTVQAFSTGQVQVGDHGYKKVDEGAVAHCGTNTAQQCIKFESPMDGINITSVGNLDVSCTPSGDCVFPFKFNKQHANMTITCLDQQGKSSGIPGEILARFGKVNVPHGGTKYASYALIGEGITAKWESEEDYTLQAALALDHYPKKKAETLYVKCT
ncbi:uncharacterized protein FA14DRAFT_153316 [Meira miltonrushii]|uniref:Ubiquitin 3 binding protein But2 C-terminal domain-containing protein n=1 Tax=Meira miltonrushii TaxID=1280837 RepID=A0A316VKC9_9BASI|nr:uncharacterized protein FA14DRAFT_153316 [Meira miltonrushii]PWN37970.1 hypothetical protein FA14DRAFT_153316 [Meira miltonrushii]